MCNDKKRCKFMTMNRIKTHIFELTETENFKPGGKNAETFKNIFKDKTTSSNFN